MAHLVQSIGGVVDRESIQHPKSQGYSSSLIMFFKHYKGTPSLNQYILKSTFPFPLSFLSSLKFPRHAFLQRPEKFLLGPKQRLPVHFPLPLSSHFCIPELPPPKNLIKNQLSVWKEKPGTLINKFVIFNGFLPPKEKKCYFYSFSFQSTQCSIFTLFPSSSQLQGWFYRKVNQSTVCV